MRQARHLHPEWGFLAPPPSFSRAIRTFVIATVVGATAGAGVILSLADRAPDQMSVAARTLAAPTSAAPVQTASSIRPPSLMVLSAQVKAQSVIASESAKATLSPVTQTKPVAYSAPAQKKANKKHHAGPRYASRGRQFTSLMDDWYHAVGL
jgi:hypothetical protein